MKLTAVQAEKLFKVARESISAYFEGVEYAVPADIAKEFSEERGVFVTLYVKNLLHGCIGFPEPIMPLAESVAVAAKSAAFEDPRFPTLKKEEAEGMRVEISVLTKPEIIAVKSSSEYISKIKIGEDGLIVKNSMGAGLLLPQVATEWDWQPKEFLDNTCRKAGLEPNSWKNKSVQVFKFQAQIFTEEHGKIVEKKL